MQIREYKIKEKIYESTNSVIYRAYRLYDNLPVVLKKLNRKKPTPIENSRFRREYSIAKRFNDDGIIAVYEQIEVDNSLYIVMEDCGGEAIDRHISKFRKLSIKEQLEIVVKLVCCLSVVNKNKIIHLDINPSNIVWHPVLNKLKIIDFGISTEISAGVDSINPDSLEGTLYYMSPEQTGRINRPIDYRSDIYSFGVMLYELFSGQLPFVDEDPLALIYSHIAIKPICPGKFNKKIPAELSKIILKLISKDADERYQSFDGLSYDLNCCLKGLSQSGDTQEPFIIASKDISSRLSIPKKIIFRGEQNEKLLKSFKKVCDTGNPSITFVSGKSGVGKTVFVKEIMKDALKRKAFFITGKLGEMEQSTPHAIIIQAFHSLFKEILSYNDKKLEYWVDRISRAVYPNGRILSSVIPIAKYLITDHPPLLEVESQEAINRFNQCFLDLISVIADKRHPLILFVDDLQWADDSIFNLLKLLYDQKIKYLYVIGVYRRDEVDDSHPLTGFKNRLHESNADVLEINLRSFSRLETTEYVGRVLNGGSEKLCTDLAHLLYLKTKGNPLFIIESLYRLYDLGALYRSLDGQWSWDRSAGEDISDVVSLIIGKMATLSEEAKKVIQTAACIDSKVSIEKLIIATGYSQAIVFKYLKELVFSGYLSTSESFKYIDESKNRPIQVYFAFPHDRIRQAAYHSNRDISLIHYKIGLSFWSIYKDSKHEKGVNVYDIVKQCNKASDKFDKVNLSELNLVAGNEAREAAAWKQAAHYYEFGIKLLISEDRAWKDLFHLTYQLYCGAAEMALLACDFDRVMALCEETHRKTINVIDRCAIWDIMIRGLIAQGKPVDAYKIGIDVLRRKLNTKIKTRMPKALLLFSLFKTKFLLDKLLKNNSFEKKMTDPMNLAISKMLMRISTAAYVSGSPSFVSIVLTSVWMFIKYGYSPYTTYALTGFAGFMGVVGRYKDAFRYSELAIKYSERNDSKPSAAKTVYIATAFTGIYNKPYRDLQDNVRIHYKVGLETGDLENAAFNIYCYSYLLFLSGVSLEKINRIMNKYEVVVRQQDIVCNFYVLYHQMVQNLLGFARNPKLLIGNACNEVELEKSLKRDRNEIGLFDLYTKQLVLAYILYDYGGAEKSAMRAINYIKPARTKHDVPIAMFYQSLTICALYREKQSSITIRSKIILRKNLKKIKTLSKSSPLSFAHKYLLLKAEYLSIIGDYQRAEQYYQSAADKAKFADIGHERAIIYELMATFYMQRGFEDIFILYIKKAYDQYIQWGAVAKCRVMESKYKVLKNKGKMCSEEGQKLRDTITKSSSDSFEGDIDVVDYLSVLKATRLISSEFTDVETIANKLLTIVIENAGAQRGAIVFKDGSFICKDTDENKQSKESNNPYPKNIINYVARTKNKVVIGDVRNSSTPFKKDVYFGFRDPRALLCMPIERKKEIGAIIYLESSVAPHVFSRQKIKIIKMLLTQATISIENANYYKIQLDKQVAEAKTKAKSQFLAHMSHEIRTPLNTILGYAELLKNNGMGHNEQYIENIVASGRLLLALVNEILDISKIESGIIKLQNTPVSIVRILNELKREYDSKFAGKGVFFEVEVDPELIGVYIEIDEYRLRQVFINLLDNAFKFTEKGSVAISVLGGQSMESVEFSIIDTGIGIEDASKIFLDYEQLHSRSINYDGCGLGLSVVNKIVSKMRGRIDVESRLGVGTEFRILIPVKICDGPYSNKENNKEQNIKFEKANILVVDDNVGNLDLISEYLKEQQLNIIKSQCGNSALKLMEGPTVVDLVLLDLKMENTGGDEVTRFLKADRRYADLPIIIITADTRPETEYALRKIGCDEYLRKPLKQKDLIDVMKKYLKYVEIEQNYSEKSDQLEGDDISCLSFDEKDGAYKEVLKLKDSWEKVTKTMIVEDIKVFAMKNIEKSELYNIKGLSKWANDLIYYADGYDITKIEKSLERYGVMLAEAELNIKNKQGAINNSKSQ